MNLRGQVAVITGAGRGIGREIALALSREGCRVVLAARTGSEIEEVASEIRNSNSEFREALPVAADVTSWESVQSLAGKVQETWGAPEILVNNAAAFARGNIVDLPVEDWDRVLNTNLRGPFLLCKAFLPAMIQRGSGAIVNISSTSGKRSDPGSSAYGASKFGVNGFSTALLYEVRQFNIRVIVVSPSSVDTRPEKGKRASGKGSRLAAEDVALSVVNALKLPPRALVREIELWNTNP